MKKTQKAVNFYASTNSATINQFAGLFFTSHVDGKLETHEQPYPNRVVKSGPLMKACTAGFRHPGTYPKKTRWVFWGTPT